MEPTLSDGDHVICIRPRSLRPGSVYLVRHPRLGRMVKRLGADGRLCGDSDDSTGPDRLGPIAECEVLGRAWLAVRPSGVTRLRARPPCSRRA